jgi:hypothetical protein
MDLLFYSLLQKKRNGGISPGKRYMSFNRIIYGNEEFRAVEGSEYPQPLYVPHFENIYPSRHALNWLGIYDKQPWDIKRIDLFGREPAFTSNLQNK